MSVTTDIAEVVDPPRKRIASYYIVLLLLVLPIWSAVPFSWVFVIYALRTGRIWSFAWLGRILFTVALCEVFFSIHHYRLARNVSRAPPYVSGNMAELQTAYMRVLKAGLARLPEDGFDQETLEIERPGSPAETIERLEHDDPLAIEFRNVTRNWFGRAPWSSIRLQEVNSWLYWSIFNAALPPLESLSSTHRAALDHALNLLQKRTGSIIPKGSAPSIKPMRPTVDETTIICRPLSWYAIITGLNWGIKKWLQYAWDTHYGSHNGLEYLIRIPVSWNPITGPRPIVFVHGLGLGLLQYQIILYNLLHTFPSRPLLVYLQPHISQNIFHPRYLAPMTRHEAAGNLAGLMVKLGWVDDPLKRNEDKEPAPPISMPKHQKGVTMLSHSNGSYTHAWMLKGYSQMITRSAFIDPVTFCSWEGDVCHNFLYRPCTTGLDLLMKYYVATELGVANLLQRHFDWSSNALWYEDIPNARDPVKTMFILGAKDSILDARRVKRYLTSHGISKGLWVDPNGIHGQALVIGGKGHTEILRWLQKDL
jgi:hypothetical protein